MARCGEPEPSSASKVNDLTAEPGGAESLLRHFQMIVRRDAAGVHIQLHRRPAAAIRGGERKAKYRASGGATTAP